MRSVAGAEVDSDWDRKRRDIVNGAAEVFYERGFERGTTKEIAERVGLSQPSIYHYVGSKEDLLGEIARQVDRDFSSALDVGLAEAEDPADQLRAVIRSFVEMIVLNQVVWAVYWQEERFIPADVARPVYNSELRYIRRVDDVVRACQDDGVLPSEHPTHVLTEAILGMLSWTYRWYKPGGPYGPAELASAFADLIGLGERGR